MLRTAAKLAAAAAKPAALAFRAGAVLAPGAPPLASGGVATVGGARAVVHNDVPYPLHDATLSDEQAAGLPFALEAASLLEGVKAGEYVVVTDAGSPVGLAAIQLAKAGGVKTIAVVPPQPDAGAVLQLCKDLGAEAAVTEYYVYEHRFAALVEGCRVAKVLLAVSPRVDAAALKAKLPKGGSSFKQRRALLAELGPYELNTVKLDGALRRVLAEGGDVAAYGGAGVGGAPAPAHAPTDPEGALAAAAALAKSGDLTFFATRYRESEAADAARAAGAPGGYGFRPPLVVADALVEGPADVFSQAFFDWASHPHNSGRMTELTLDLEECVLLLLLCLRCCYACAAMPALYYTARRHPPPTHTPFSRYLEKKRGMPVLKPMDAFALIDADRAAHEAAGVAVPAAHAPTEAVQAFLVSPEGDALHEHYAAKARTEWVAANEAVVADKVTDLLAFYKLNPGYASSLAKAGDAAKDLEAFEASELGSALLAKLDKDATDRAALTAAADAHRDAQVDELDALYESGTIGEGAQRFAAVPVAKRASFAEFMRQ